MSDPERPDEAGEGISNPLSREDIESWKAFEGGVVAALATVARLGKSIYIGDVRYTAVPSEELSRLEDIAAKKALGLNAETSYPDQEI